jgi:hypothetical protein
VVPSVNSMISMNCHQFLTGLDSDSNTMVPDWNGQSQETLSRLVVLQLCNKTDQGHPAARPG